MRPNLSTNAAINNTDSALFYVRLSVGDGQLVTLCHPGQAFPPRLARSAAFVTRLRVQGHAFGSQQGV